MAGNREQFQRTCKYCGTEFATTKEKQVYCCSRCRFKAYRDSRVEISKEEWEEYMRLKELVASAGMVG